VDVLGQFLGSHVHVPNGNAEAQDFLHLELDGTLDLINLVHHGFRVGEEERELPRLVETGPKESWNLLDKSLTCQKGVILLG